jgi:serine-type D-Ala-D-Ala carboxypeptidase/endopeptidase (penicillin-binding protein 4)
MPTGLFCFVLTVMVAPVAVPWSVSASAASGPGLLVQVPVGEPPVTGIGGDVPMTQPPLTQLPSQVPATQVPATQVTTAPKSAATAKSGATTKKARRIVRRSTIAGQAPPDSPAVAPTAATTIVLDVSVPASIGGVGAGSVDPNAQPPVLTGETTSTLVGDIGAPTTVPTLPTVPGNSGTAVTTVQPATTKAVPSTAPLPATPAELRQSVLSVLATASGQQSIVISIGGQTIVSLNPSAERVPASTQKVYVAGAILTAFGPDHRFQTTVRSTPISNGIVADLTLIAGADPSFSTADLADLARQIKTAGITSVTGRVVLDDSLFDQNRTAPGWKPEFSPGEVGLLNALMVDGNHRNDPASRTDIGLANLARFVGELTKAGVTVSSSVEQLRGPAAEGAIVIATNKSGPVIDLVTLMVKKSENTYAEVLMKHLGTRTGQGSTRAGVTAAADFFAKLGTPPPVAMADGSGLSNLNRSTAESQVAYLSKMSGQKLGAAFRASMSIACVDGTLKSRMCGTTAAKNVVAKTGSLNNVSTLTGYATTASNKPVVFSMLVNNASSTARARVAMDKALVLVTSYRG